MTSEHHVKKRTYSLLYIMERSFFYKNTAISVTRQVRVTVKELIIPRYQQLNILKDSFLTLNCNKSIAILL